MKKLKRYIILLIIFLTFINLNSIINILNTNNLSIFKYQLQNKHKPKNSDNSWKVNYEIANNNTSLVTGLISRKGNTKDKPVLELESVDNSNSSPASLKISINENCIDLLKSYCEQGIVNESNNNFIGKEKIVNHLSKNFILNKKGIYHLHLVDIYSLDYDSYIEIGNNYHQLYWKIPDENKPIFEQQALKLNVIIENLKKLEDIELKKLSSFFNKYKFDAKNAFIKSVKLRGKGFEITLKICDAKYSDFLDSNRYLSNNLLNKNINLQEKINYQKLNSIIDNTAYNLLQNSLLKIKNGIIMHGYELNQIINSEQMPKTKHEIEHYRYGKSFGTWLQETINFKFFLWQLKIKITIEFLVIMIIIVIISTVLYLRHRRIYQPIILKEFQLNKQQIKWLKTNKKFLWIYQFVNLSRKKHLIFLKVSNLNNFCLIQEIFKNSLDNINYKNYDNIFYNHKRKTVLSGKEFIKIFLNCKNIEDYVEKILLNYPNCLFLKFHKTVIYDVLNFYFKKIRNSININNETNFDANTKINLSKIRFFLDNHEWNYYFFELQNLMHLALVDFLKWKGKALNFMIYSKLLKRKLFWILQSEAKVEKYLTIIQQINFYRNLICKVSPIKQEKLIEWHNLTDKEKESLAWNIYNSLIEFIKFTKDYNDKNITK